MIECSECGTPFTRQRGSNVSLCSTLCRFLAKVDMSGDCWEWTATKINSGYGHFRSDDGSLVLAHRWSYEFAVGPIPEGLEVDHLCRNRGCVNPDHLEPVTQRENFLRGESPLSVGYRLNVCRRGHPMVDPIIGPNGVRRCRPCRMANRNRVTS